MAIKSPFSSIDLLRDAFAARGYTIERFELGARGYTRFVAPGGAAWLTADAHIIYPFPSSSARSISLNKDRAYELARTQGVPLAKTMVIEQGDVDASDVLAAMGQGPLVVKPNDSTLSRGLTMNVSTEDQLLEAISYARGHSMTVLVQQQMQGEEIRFAVLDGKVKVAVQRQRLRVTGDGESTVKQLLAAENEARKQLTFNYLEYPQITADVVSITPDTLAQVPGKSETVILGQSSMLKNGASLYNVTDKVDESYITMVENLTVPFGKGFMVADVLIEDYTQPQTDRNCSFMEFNMAPVLNHFYSVRGGGTYDIIGDLVQAIDATLAGRNV